MISFICLFVTNLKNGGDSGAGLQREYEKVDDLNHLVRMVAALPFSPPDKLEEVFHNWGKILCEMSLKRMRRRRRALPSSGMSPSLNCFTTPESVIAL